MTYCNHCGTELNDGAKFCSECGMKTEPVKTTESQRKTVFDGEIHKCSNCGETLKSFESVCPICGFEIRGKTGSGAVQALSDKLEKATTEEQRIIIVKTFPIPNTKEDIFEFMLLALGNFDLTYYENHLDEDDISDAWLAKAEQCYQKAKLILKDTDDLIKIESLYKAINDRIQDHSLEIKNSEFKKEKEIKQRKMLLIGGVSIVLLLTVFLITFFSVRAYNNPDKITIGINDYEIVGEEYEAIAELLMEKGFTDIEAVDDGWSKGYDIGDVTRISIDGKITFDEKTKFKKTSKVLIHFCSEPQSIKIDISYEDLLGEKYFDVVDIFEAMGFKNIETREENNILKKNETVKKILFDGIVGFDTSAEYKESVKIVVVYY